MSEPDERMRRGALALLDDGNSVEAVARVLGVPVDTVLDWRAGRTPAPLASQTAAASPPRDDPAALRFDETLHYAASPGFRATGLIGAIAVAAWSVDEALTMAGGDRAGLIEQALAGVTLAAGACAAVILLRWSLRSLVLQAERLVVPGLVRAATLAYADIGSYSFVAGHLKLDADVAIKGRTLVIRSRRAGVRPLAVFIHDARPMDPRIVERLDKVLNAHRAAEYRALFARLESCGVKL